VVRDGDEFVVSGTMDLTEAAMGAESVPGIGDSFDIKIAMTFPGKVTEHNGELSGNTVTWTPVYGEVNEFSARASALDGGGGGLSLPLLIGIAAAALLVLGLVLFLVLRSRKGGQPAEAVATAYPEPATSYTPGQAQAPYAPVAPPMGAPAAPPMGAPPAPPAPPVEQAPPAPPAPPVEQAPPAPPAPPVEQAPPAPPAPPVEQAPPAPPAPPVEQAPPAPPAP